MKRISAIIVVIALIVSCGSALADVYEKPILFRGIEWGSTYQETLSALSKTGLTFRNPSDRTGYPVKKTILEDWYGSGYDYTTGFYTHTSYNSPSIKVAGYNATDVYLYFAYTTLDDNTLPLDTGHSSFYLARYTLEVTDLEASTNDMIVKLTSLYGDVDETSIDDLIIKEHYYFFYGQNGTIAVVQSEEYSSGTKNLYVWYGWTGADVIMQTANDIQHQAAVDAERQKFGTDNTDGL